MNSYLQGWSQVRQDEALNYLGIDISKDKFDVALIVDEREFPFKQRVFSNDSKGFEKFKKWIESRSTGEVHAAMEATGSYWEALAVYLCDLGIDVSVVNPGLVKKEAESWNVRNKTDKLDATVIARFCLAKQPRLWSAPKAEVRELRDLVRHLESLEDEKQRHQNRLGSGAVSDAVVSSLCEVIEFLDSQIDDLERRIRDHIGNHPGLKADSLLLESIPGIGEKTAAIILAELQEVSNFTCAKQVAAYAGVSPKKTMSGKFVGKTRMCKIGNSRLRKAMYFPAIVASTFNPVVRALYKRLLRRGACKMSAIGACMRKLLAIAYGVLKTGTSFEVPA